MKKRPLALVGAGPVSRSFLVRLPWVTEQIGPIFSFSYRLASRIANSLRAGFPSADYRDFDDVRTLLVSVPARLLPLTVDQLLASPVDWRHRAVLLCDAEQDSRALAALAARGAAVASFAPLEGFDPNWLLLEGDRPALITARRLLAHRDVRLIELRPNRKAAYLAGIAFLGDLSVPTLAAAGDCFRHAGLSPHLTAMLIERLSQRTLRGFLKSGRKSLAALKVHADAAALEPFSPDLAAMWTDAVRAAARARRHGKARAASA
jgi:hypothetical protein